ncbi:hypothetical protein C5167_044227 [Papaver somniferum]|uniref:Uncharacterized protein n=1 Tax=Papaver somniferum TaxID=3469 RepID=A0A4Y7L9I7_PAPSO|nr:hypothetical protein C5167_044227 [Papaver somniferum]
MRTLQRHTYKLANGGPSYSANAGAGDVDMAYRVVASHIRLLIQASKVISIKIHQGPSLSCLVPTSSLWERWLFQVCKVGVYNHRNATYDVDFSSPLTTNIMETGADDADMAYRVVAYHIRFQETDEVKEKFSDPKSISSIQLGIRT